MYGKSLPTIVSGVIPVQAGSRKVDTLISRSPRRHKDGKYHSTFYLNLHSMEENLNHYALLRTTSWARCESYAELRESLMRFETAKYRPKFDILLA